MTIETVIIVQCDQCKTEEAIPANNNAVWLLEACIEQSREDGWWIDASNSDGSISAICPDCRNANEPYDRADAKYPERM